MDPGSNTVPATPYKDPVFILAPPRSFTSLVCGMLGQHPQMLGLPELNLFQAADMEAFWTGRDAGGKTLSPFWAVMRHGLLRTVAQLYAGEQTIDSIRMAERWVRVRAKNSTGDAYRELCATASPLWLVDKSPGYVRKQAGLDRLLECFPGARFIHLTRHPRGQCQSMLKARGGAMVLFLLGAIDRRRPEPVLDPQILWHDAHARILGFLEKLPPWQWVHIRGEDATARFEETMTRLCRWLGISADAAALEAMRHPERSPFACIGPANARLGNDINFLMSPRLKPQRQKALQLEPPLEWRPDGAGFHPWVASLARELGYQ